MSILDWYRYHVKDGSVSNMFYHLNLGLWRKLGEQITFGTPIWEDPWDVMVVLDGCRYDTMKAVAGEFDWCNDVSAEYSVGSESGDWMETTFSTEKYQSDLSSTAYVTANGKTDQHINSDNLYKLDEVWRYAFDFDWGTVPAKSVTDRAIDVARSDSPDRLLVHYMQPHFPVVPPASDGESVPDCLLDSNWEHIRQDPTVTSDVLSRFAVKNLRYVMNSVERLLQNIDAERVVITADHGNLFGEFEALGLWGHPPNLPVPLLKRVPWVVTDAENTANEDPELEPSLETGDLEEKLSALGYK